MLMQHAQIELDNVPADNRVRVVQRQPLVKALEQLRAGIAIVELKIQRLVATIDWAQHVDLALTTALQRNRIQLAAGRGFDIQRDQLQVGTVIGCRLDLRVAEHAIGIRRAAKLHRRSDEALHQVAFWRSNVRFVDVYIAPAQQLFDIHQLAVLLAVNTQHRAVTEITEFQRAQPTPRSLRNNDRARSPCSAGIKATEGWQGRRIWRGP